MPGAILGIGDRAGNKINKKILPLWSSYSSMCGLIDHKQVKYKIREMAENITEKNKAGMEDREVWRGGKSEKAH